MPRKRDLPRTRRVIVWGMGAIGLAFVGVFAIFSAGGAVLDHEASGWLGVCAGVAMLVLGGVVLVRLARRADVVRVQERDLLERRGRDDGLPMGMFIDGDRVGIEGSDNLVIVGAMLGIVGLAIAVLVFGDPNAGWPLAVPIAVVSVVAATPLIRAGTGPVWWVTPSGIQRARRPASAMRWEDVARIAPRFRGRPESNLAVADELRLLAVSSTRAPERSVRHLSIRTRRLEVDNMDVVRLIEERMPPGRQPRLSRGSVFDTPRASTPAPSVRQGGQPEHRGPLPALWDTQRFYRLGLRRAGRIGLLLLGLIVIEVVVGAPDRPWGVAAWSMGFALVIASAAVRRPAAFWPASLGVLVALEASFIHATNVPILGRIPHRPSAHQQLVIFFGLNALILLFDGFVAGNDSEPDSGEPDEG